MPTILELMEPVAKEEKLKESLMHDKVEEDKLKKANKVKRLKKLSAEGARISFTVITPGTTHERPVHVVTMTDSEVRKTKDGNYIITGVDIEETLKKDLERGVLPENLSIKKRREGDFAEIRSYRVDRIINGSITWF